MDEILSEFIAKTSCKPGFARDLLNHHDWNLATALKSYYRMNEIIKEKNLTSINEQDSVTKSDPIVLHKDIFLVPNKCTSEPSLSPSQSSEACDSSVVSSPIKLSSKLNLKDQFVDKKLSRGISRASDNENLISKARKEVAQDFMTSTRGSRLLNLDKLLETPDFTFTLPDIYSFPDKDFCEFLKKDLIEKSTLTSLESSKRLNWWSNICIDLFPLVTSGDGNCLLHAASLGMWGFHDRGLILRRALHILLSNSSYTQAFYRRWRWQTHFQNHKTGLSFSEKEWEDEWKNIVRLASTEPRSKYSDHAFEISGGKKEPNEYEYEKSFTYESLEEIHIFVLAHVLRRPIIVIADTMLKDSKGEAFFPISFGGIYLPLECPDDCLMKSPLCLTYDAAHFSALVAMNKEKDIEALGLCEAIPLMDSDHNILPLHFAIDPGEEIFTNEISKIDVILEDLAKNFILTEQDKIELLKKYFDIATLSNRKNEYVEAIPELKKPSTIIEKSHTLPSDFGRKNDYSTTRIKDDYRSKTFYLNRATAKNLLQKPFVSLGKMSRCIKKNLSHLARRSTSFRSTKSTDVIDNATISNKIYKNKFNCLTKNDLNETVEENTAIQEESIINTENSIFYCETFVLAAKLLINKKHFYYEEMIDNYLSTAHLRFCKEQDKLLQDELASRKKIESIPESSSTSSSSSSSSSSLYSLKSNTGSHQSICSNENEIKCVSPDCSAQASQSTHYLCQSCFEEQKQVLLEKNYSAKKTKTDGIDESRSFNDSEESKKSYESPLKSQKDGIQEDLIINDKKLANEDLEKEAKISDQVFEKMKNYPSDDEESIYKLKNYNHDNLINSTQIAIVKTFL
ncbi:OTU and UBA-like domain-containing protein [Sarcoptes scabiei]|uniref:ubiquitinyl hydrolase 1 n=1 Tax=Sarcoptes scabiei TaxID=52283 RepID=A0A132A1P4_SARSC|nr:OTU and UBA-like domain-containing protein [Sarcoptes scabiei]